MWRGCVVWIPCVPVLSSAAAPAYSTRRGKLEQLRRDVEQHHNRLAEENERLRAEAEAAETTLFEEREAAAAAAAALAAKVTRLRGQPQLPSGQNRKYRNYPSGSCTDGCVGTLVVLVSACIARACGLDGSSVLVTCEGYALGACGKEPWAAASTCACLVVCCVFVLKRPRFSM